MKLVLLFTLIFSLSNFAHADWEKILLNEPKNSSNSEKQHSKHTEGIEIDFEEKTRSPKNEQWISQLTKNPNKESKLSPEVADMLDKISQMDRMLPDDSIAKHVLFSQFAIAYLHAGDFLQAETISLRSIRMAERLSGKNSEETLRCTINLALLYEAIGDYERALEIALRSLEICEQNPKDGSRHKPVAQGLVAGFQLELGNHTEAEKNAKESLQAARAKVKIEDPFVIVKPLRVISALNYHQGNYKEAEENLNEALSYVLDLKKQKAANQSRLEKVLRESIIDSTILTILSNLFQLHLAANDPAAARQVLVDYEKIQVTRDVPESIKKTQNIDFSQWIIGKAILEQLSGNNSLAQKYAQEYLAFHKQNLDAALLLVESQRLNWQRRYLDFSIPVAFCTPQELADIVLAWKGIVLDSLGADRYRIARASSSKNKDTFQQLADLRRQLSQALIQHDTQSREEVQILKNKIFSAERTLSKTSGTSTDKKVASSTWQDVQKHMQADSVVVEFISYRELPDIRNGKRHYGAIVLLSQSDPLWVPIAPAEEVEAAVRQLQQCIAQQNSDEPALEAALRHAHEVVFSKIEEKIPATISKIYLSPDGVLNFTPFSCLLRKDGSFVAEKYAVAYIGSSRDLLKQIVENPERKLHLVANPVFDATVDTKVLAQSNRLNRALQTTEFSRINLHPLPGTQLEANRLLAIAKNAGWESQALTAEDATEVNLYKIASPKILHLATHGFFLGGRSESTSPDETNRGMAVKPNPEHQPKSDNPFEFSPMLQSGIALAGAQTTLQSWGQGRAPAPENDGILTAEEVAALNLEGTWLVTLSACETGVGEARSGEGVFGLRRAFMMAGTQNLLMTLWPVNDAATADFMADFYTKALATKDAPQALAETQRDWLINLRKDKGLHTAVRDAGPFLIATTGKDHPASLSK